MKELLKKLPSYLKYAPYSFSRMSSFMSCPRRFYYQYVNPLPAETGEPSIYLEKGGYIHSLLEFYVKHFKIYNELLPLGRLKELYHTELEYPHNFMGNIAEFEAVFTTYINTDRFRGFIHNATTLEVEEYLELKLPNSEIILFRGYVDLYIIMEFNKWIIDYKSGKDKEYEAEQLKLYAIMEMLKFNTDKVIVSYEKLEHNTKNDYVITYEEAYKYLDELINLILAIESVDPQNITKWETIKTVEYKNDDGDLVVGSNCTYCVGKTICEEQFKSSIKSLLKGSKNG